MKTELVVRPGNIAIKFEEKSVFLLSYVSLHTRITNNIMNTLAQKMKT